MFRRLLLTAVLVCGFSILSTAVTISGFLDQELRFDFGANFDEFRFDTEIGLEAGFGAWNIGTFIDLESDGMEDLEFFTLGRIGAFDVYSIFEFHAIDGDNLGPGNIKEDWDTAVWTRIAGVDLWGVFSILAGDDPVDGWISGVGAAWGLHGQAGDLEIWSEMRFNMHTFVRWVVWNGIEKTVRFNQGCDTISVEEANCDLDFNYANIYARIPLDCMEVGARVGFHDAGFSNIRFWLTDVDTPVDWLDIDVLHLRFHDDAKEYEMELGLDLAEAFCITPYFSLVQDTPTAVKGIQLDALGFEAQFENVAFVASGMFDEVDYFIRDDARIDRFDRGEAYGYTLFPDCRESMSGMELALGIEVGVPGCCATQKLGVYGFFGPFIPTALFDLNIVRIMYEDHITPQLAWSAEFIIEVDSAPWVEFTFSYDWGDVQITNSMESCCNLLP